MKPELDTSKLQFSTGNGRRVTGDSKSEIKLCYIFQAVWLGVAWSGEKAAFLGRFHSCCSLSVSSKP